MKYVSCFLLLSCFTLPEFAQGEISFAGEDIIGVDVAFQIGGTKAHSAQSPLGGRNIAGIGGRVGYHLGSIVFLDGEILHEPEALRAEEEKTVVLGGVRLGTIFDDTIGIFAKTRVGALRINTDILIPEKDFHPVFDYGVILEYYVPFNNRSSRKILTRFDIGGWTVPFGDTRVYDGLDHEYMPIYKRLGTQHFLAVEVGIGFRF